MTYYLGWSNNRLHHYQHEDHFTADEALRDKPKTRNTLERIKGVALTIGLNIASNGLYDGLFWLLRHH